MKRSIKVAAGGAAALLAGGVAIGLVSRSGHGTVVRVDASSQTTVSTVSTVPSLTIPPVRTIPSAAVRAGADGAAEEMPGACAANANGYNSISIVVSNSGFAHSCYDIQANAPTTVTLTDNAINHSTGLTIPVELVVAELTAPVVGVAARNSAPTAPGLTYPTTPAPVVQLSNAVFTSPTATTSSPITFRLPALAAASRLLQLPTLPAASGAVLTADASGAVAGTEYGPPPTAGGSAGAAASSLPGSTSDQIALMSAFNVREALPSTCLSQLVAGSDRYAALGSTDWAMARFQPVAGCTAALKPATPGGPARPLDPRQIGPFGVTNGVVAVFERPSGSTWTMNQEDGTPFPCPAPVGIAPGPDNGALPLAVLQAWGMSYGSNCAFPTYAQQRLPLRP